MCFYQLEHTEVNSFLELVEYIFTIDGIKVFLSERLSQDPLEKFFGCQRQRGTTNENPNVVQFCKNTQALRVINGVCGNISKSNCRGNKTSVDWGKENCQLPKRRKCKTIQAVTLPEQQDHLVGNSTIKEDPSEIIMSLNTTKQEEFNRDKIAQPVYPSQLIQLINNAIESGRAEEELSNGFHISLKRSDFWLLCKNGWLNDKVSKQ